ncbi:penicillin binding protein transpeptidase domain-containing protein [Leptospira semungkisensis]|uniref:Penicillin binding protein transpeptidase domain-containing protein n=1 Tax=Leptospira semungkisensis TaxID=2484985 RepID=A0A4R9FLN9_9LEPT|nr:penicillin-binding transpeptidase domain-containing protein [Leptospira semungkisensis]TGJ99575.1 penicillin binding protein transpeptidase domain-containing protein [Leptospira semungkisensis]
MKGILGFSFFLILVSCSVKTGTDSPRLEREELSFTDKKVCILLAELGEGNLVRVGESSCKQTAPSMYIFQPILALSALETGSLKDPHGNLPWDKTKFPYLRWQKEQNLRSALENSTIWYFQKLWMDTGALKIRAWLGSVGLPTSVPTDPNRAFWMDGGYVWTAEEFYSFLWKLFDGELNLREKNLRSVLEGLERIPGEVKNPSGSHRLDGNWGPYKEFYSDSGTGYAGGRSVSWYWFFWKTEKKSYLFLTRLESETETFSSLEAAKFGVAYLREKGIWEKYFSN